MVVKGEGRGGGWELLWRSRILRTGRSGRLRTAGHRDRDTQSPPHTPKLRSHLLKKEGKGKQRSDGHRAAWVGTGYHSTALNGYGGKRFSGG
jgi:hypothetical protein